MSCTITLEYINTQVYSPAGVQRHSVPPAVTCLAHENNNNDFIIISMVLLYTVMILGLGLLVDGQGGLQLFMEGRGCRECDICAIATFVMKTRMAFCKVMVEFKIDNSCHRILYLFITIHRNSHSPHRQTPVFWSPEQPAISG